LETRLTEIPKEDADVEGIVFAWRKVYMTSIRLDTGCRIAKGCLR